MSAPKIDGLGITQDGFSMRWRPTGHVEDIGWLEAWGATGVALGPCWGADAAPAVVSSSVVLTSAPPVLASPVAPPTAWYYCDHPQGYYPDVSQCLRGWRAVSPTPAP
jgi:hypothetical protein